MIMPGMSNVFVKGKRASYYPRAGLDGFMIAFEDQLELVHKQYQLVLKKIANQAPE